VKVFFKEKRKHKTYGGKGDGAGSFWSFCEATNVTNIFHKQDLLAWSTYSKSTKGVLLKL